MTDTIRWTVKVSRSTDISVRMHLAQKGLKKGDLSKFIEDAVRRQVFQQTVAETKARNKNMSTREVDAAVEAALVAVHAERFTRRA
jgi:histone acetyltransferase (RNA polymerase elongator complex component)